MKVHEKSTVFRQGEVMPFSWTEVGFMMDCPEGITLRFNLTSEKEIIGEDDFSISLIRNGQLRDYLPT